MTTNLIDINVNQLFEQHSVAEIDLIQKKIDTEVERKREELRTMVGERYRDLLKAADTIAVMKESSSLLLSKVQNITTNCKSLNDRQLIGFKTIYENPAASKQLNRYFSTVVQIKLLTSFPELIWSHIDQERFFVATQLFIFARHISTGLQLDMTNGVMQFFPVAKKQWEVLKPFYVTLKQKTSEVLGREQLSPELAADCLLSQFLLEKSNLDTMLKNFVMMRSTAFESSLKSDSDGKKRPKEKLLASLTVLNSTIELMYKCFFGNNGGMFFNRLRQLSSESTHSTIYLMNIEDQELISTLPEIISKFKPKFDVPILSEDSVRVTISDWLQSVNDISKKQLKRIFQLVVDMTQIQEIKKEALALERDTNWNAVCQQLHLPPALDFYDLQYKPQINERIQEIVRQSWIKCAQKTFESIEDAVRRPSAAENSDNIWLEDAQDIPLSLKDAISSDWKLKRLLMKTKGYNENILTICSDFDSKLNSIVAEVDVLLKEANAQGDDNIALVEFLREISEQQMLDLVDRIKKMQFEPSKESILFVSRIFLAFIELCSNLKICMSRHYSKEQSWMSDTKVSEKWLSVCAILEEDSFAFSRQFCQNLLNECEFGSELSTPIRHDLILKDFVNWDTITIEGKDEQDNTVKSTIRIPAQPRLSLQQYMFQISKTLNSVVPQTVPIKVLLHLISEMTAKLLKIYEELTQHTFVKSNQNTALQLYFDLKFIQSTFIARDDRQKQDEFKKLTSVLKESIDPFDFELFYSHLNANVRKCWQSMYFELGLLLPFPEMVSAPDAKQNSFGHEIDPNVLNLASNGSSSTWFPLLPIISQNSKGLPSLCASKDADKAITESKPKKTSRTQTAAKQSASSKSGAAAFFGSDWFSR